jgi:hypothetical protein
MSKLFITIDKTKKYELQCKRTIKKENSKQRPLLFDKNKQVFYFFLDANVDQEFIDQHDDVSEEPIIGWLYPDHALSLIKTGIIKFDFTTTKENTDYHTAKLLLDHWNFLYRENLNNYSWIWRYLFDGEWFAVSGTVGSVSGLWLALDPTFVKSQATMIGILSLTSYITYLLLKGGVGLVNETYDSLHSKQNKFHFPTKKEMAEVLEKDRDLTFKMMALVTGFMIGNQWNIDFFKNTLIKDGFDSLAICIANFMNEAPKVLNNHDSWIPLMLDTLRLFPTIFGAATLWQVFDKLVPIDNVWEKGGLAGITIAAELYLFWKIGGALLDGASKIVNYCLPKKLGFFKDSIFEESKPVYNDFDVFDGNDYDELNNDNENLIDELSNANNNQSNNNQSNNNQNNYLYNVLN